jgi:DNA repair protein RecN (Recombination protein N)
VQALAPEDGGGVNELLSTASAGLSDAAGHDPALGPLAERLEGLRLEAEDLAGELRRYVDSVDAAPGRLEEVEERLAVLARLTRKHGGTVADVLRHAETCRQRQAELENADEALAEGRDELDRARATQAAVAEELTARRRAAATELSGAVRERLAELAMPDASFEVALSSRPDGPGPRGADVAEFLIAPNPGLPAGALREIASGGELSRVMLALLSVAHARGDAARELPLLVFDEIDAGIGGHTARAVGEQLRALARGRQILCITHLPQVAALGARHFTIAKDGSVAPARTTVTQLDGDEVVGELVRMLGAGEDDRAARGHVRQLLKAA